MCTFHARQNLCLQWKYTPPVETHPIMKKRESKNRSILQAFWYEVKAHRLILEAKVKEFGMIVHPISFFIYPHCRNGIIKVPVEK